MPLRLDSVSVNSVVAYDAEANIWRYFQQPLEVLIADSPDQIIPLLERVQQQVDRGYYAAGFVSYEAATAFDESFITHPKSNFPLAWFGIYGDFEAIELPDSSQHIALNWTASIDKSGYHDAIDQIKAYIAQGDTYQVNFSFRLRSEFLADPWAYFTQLAQSQNGQHSAFIHLENWAVCSASPELFFRCETIDQQRIFTCHPMKGTAPRGLSVQRDRHLATALQHSEKNQAENLMIVDMIRNDMGRIADLGTVQVPQLFQVEPYPTLWQMISIVQCKTAANLPEIFRSMFPCASITGAPKARTMQIIAELEDSPRQLYTGAIGVLSPTGEMQFNVAIRTVLVDKLQQTAEYSIGSGIVWDSIAADEFDECAIKAEILTRSQPKFDLLESLLWTPKNGYFLLDLHLQRLQSSADYFGFAVDLDEIRSQLHRLVQHYTAPQKVRLLLSKQGSIQLEIQSIQHPEIQPLKLKLAKAPIHPENVFLYHKTTHRLVYETAQADWPNCDDVLLWNDRNELTESCRANLIVELDCQWFTPPIECGLLAGTFRQWLLQQNKVKERVLHLSDLQHCSRLFLINSVRKLQAAIVLPNSK